MATVTSKRRLIATFVTRILTHYRIPFHEQVREALDANGIDYRLIHGQPDSSEAAKGDLATLPWAQSVENRPIMDRGKLVWQPVWHEAMASNLVVLGQENQLLVNYPLQLFPPRMRPRLALWGHGRNFQARNPKSRAEQWKRFWATRCDWWFAYTDESRRHVESLGFPPERITVFNNAVDTGGLQRLAAVVHKAEIAELRARLGIHGDTVAIFVGGLYPEKRLDFLVAAADLVRGQIPNFTLVVVGGGVDNAKLEALATTRPWLIVAGPRFGREKAALMQMAKLFLMPGLLGLAVLDAGVMGLPVVTTSYPWHSPEIAYLRDGETGVIVEPWEDAEAYATAVVALLTNEAARSAMSSSARRYAGAFTIEAMAERFAAGIAAALAAPKRRD
ncbi:glycosyltransferase family 4 protein [Sphingomonas sp. NBWT7]|uniref:glycosyltransferase family 4 protein n=1 Tax=Sphingomonas sp. NBWT7 TaxID=2596913 RepID=UPI0018615847|nr:glycosyltransferase family 4 protein [Sphingomonas sp. NBWT7]QNE32442.1 glycosyltransferase family 4 protein [Sphingomonas sp. NBWT7]